jgi:hypothetical protein
MGLTLDTSPSLVPLDLFFDFSLDLGRIGMGVQGRGNAYYT